LKINKRDIFIRAEQKRWNCLCGSGLPVYLGMSALLKNLKFKPDVFATGGIDKKGKVTPVSCLAEKIKAVLKKAAKDAEQIFSKSKERIRKIQMDDLEGREQLLKISGLRKARILDVGMGDCGSMSFFLAKREFEVMGLDSSS